MKLGLATVVLAAHIGAAGTEPSPIAKYVRTIDNKLTPENAAIAGVFGKTVDTKADTYRQHGAPLLALK